MVIVASRLYTIHVANAAIRKAGMMKPPDDLRAMPVPRKYPVPTVPPAPIKDRCHHESAGSAEECFMMNLQPAAVSSFHLCGSKT